VRDIIRQCSDAVAGRDAGGVHAGCAPVDVQHVHSLPLRTGVVWPLIAHAAWYSRFALDLARRLDAGDTDLFLAFHPFAAAAHRALVQHLADFSAFIQAYAAPPEDIAVGVARAALADIVAGTAPASIPLSAWTTLVGTDVAPIDAHLAEVSLSATSFPIGAIETIRERARVCLALEGATSQLKPAAGTEVDVLTRARLPALASPTVARRRCTRCGGCSDVPRPPVTVWLEGSLEAAWRVRCWCGGAWAVV
jgi:hypothetical protein